MTKATINDHAVGTTVRRIGEEVEVVGPGANPHHVMIRFAGEKRIVGFPTSWLDLEEPPAPRICPTCGQVIP